MLTCAVIYDNVGVWTKNMEMVVEIEMDRKENQTNVAEFY